MNPEVSQAIADLKRQFPEASVEVTDDGSGGAHVVVEPIRLGGKFRPESTWIGAHIPALYPYADIYPVFIGDDVSRADGVQFAPPITPNATFAGRPALQISRRNAQAQQFSQTAVAKVLKVLNFLENLA